jgi:hypothetical protein
MVFITDKELACPVVSARNELPQNQRAKQCAAQNVRVEDPLVPFQDMPNLRI